MKTNRYDPLDKFFRERLKANTRGYGEHWNEPPVGLFDQAMKLIDQKQKSDRKSILLFILVGLSFILLGYYAFTAYGKIDKLEHSLVELKSENLNLRKNIVAKNADPLNRKKVPSILSQQQRMLSIEKQLQNSALTTALIKRNSSNVLEKRKNIQAQYSLQNRNSSATPREPILKENISLQEKFKTHSRSLSDENILLQGNTLDTDEQIIALASKRNDRIISSVGTLPIIARGLDIGISKHLDALNYLKHRVEKSYTINHKRDKEQLSLEATYYPSKLKMSNTGDGDYVLTEYDHYYAAWGIGLKYKYSISDALKLNFGMSYKAFTNQSKYFSSISYDIKNEFINQNLQKEYTTTLRIESPVGLIRDTASFLLRGIQISNMDTLKLTSSIRQKIRLLNLSSGLSYRLMKFNRLAIYLNTGLTLQYLLKLENNLDAKIYFASDQMMDEKIQLKDRLNLRSLFLSFEGGLGIDYAINKKLSAGINVGIEYSLVSIRKIENSKSPRTYIQALPLQFMLTYHF